MFALFLSLVVLFAGDAGHGSSGGFMEFYNKYFNISGFEAWKFLNLALFVGGLIYLLRQPVSKAFKDKRNAIRAELIKAEEEKQAALGKLTVVESRLAGLGNEKSEIIRMANEEAHSEKNRLEIQTDLDISKIREQSQGEISRLQKQVLAQLKRFSAEESVRLAEVKLRSQIDLSKDAELVRSGISSMGGLKQ